MANLPVFLFLVFIASCVSNPLRTTPSFPKCNRKQADFDDCFSKAVADTISQLKQAYPKVGIPSLNPLVIPEVTIGAGTSAVQFTQNFKNIKITKLTDFTSLKAKMNFDKKVLYIEAEYPEINFDFEYDIDGKILMLPITGKGPGLMHTEQILLKLTFNLEESNNHYKVVQTKAIYDKIGHFTIHFDNLFNGDKVLGDNVNNVINENWKDVLVDVKGGYEDAGAAVFHSIFNNLLAQVTISEIFGEP